MITTTMDFCDKQEQINPDAMVNASETRKVNTTLLAQSRKMVYDVYCFMKKDAAKVNCKMTQKQLLTRTSEATQISMSTIRRILQEAKTSDIFKTPGKVRKSSKPITGLDHSHKEIVKQCIRNFQNTHKEPSISRLLSKLQSDINFKGSEASLRRILKQLGFKWNKNKKCLTEITPITPVTVLVDNVPTCSVGVTIKSEVEDHKPDAVIYKNCKIDPVKINYVGVRIKKENEVYQNDSIDYEYHETDPLYQLPLMPNLS